MSHPALWFSHIKTDRRQDTVQNIYYFFPAKQPALTWHTQFQLLATLRPGTGLTAAARAKERADPNTALGSAAPKAGKLFLFALGGPDRCDSEGTVAKFWRVARPTHASKPAAKGRSSKARAQPPGRWLPSSEIQEKTALRSRADRGRGDTSAQVLGTGGKKGPHPSRTCFTQARQII